MAKYGQPPSQPQIFTPEQVLEAHRELIQAHIRIIAQLGTIDDIDAYCRTVVMNIRPVNPDMDAGVVKHIIRDYADVKTIHTLLFMDRDLFNPQTWRIVVGHCSTILRCMKRHPVDATGKHAAHLFQEIEEALSHVLSVLQSEERLRKMSNSDFGMLAEARLTYIGAIQEASNRGIITQSERYGHVNAQFNDILVQLRQRLEFRED